MSVVNLTKAKKARAKAAAEQSAQQNRIRFGRTKAEKAFDAAQAEKRGREADAGRLEPDRR